MYLCFKSILSLKIIFKFSIDIKTIALENNLLSSNGSFTIITNPIKIKKGKRLTLLPCLIVLITNCYVIDFAPNIL